MELTPVTERLGLGRLLRPPTVLKHDEMHPVWKAETESGLWAVKVERPWGDFWLGMAAQAGALEAAAWEAGVPMPEPHSTSLGEAGLWRLIGEGAYARAIRFVEGTNPAPPVSEPLAAWAGGVVAALERLALPSDPTVDGDYRTHPPQEWEEWFAEAERLGVLDAEQIRTFGRAVERADASVAADPASQRAKQVMHRDFSYRNILVGPDGPVLLDFDSAGAQLPWWELVCTAFELAAPDIGVMRPERGIVEACVTGYADAGGRVGPLDESAFTGMFTGRVGVAAWQLWMACGHRGGSPELQAEFGRTVRASVEAMAVMFETIPTWTTWLRA